MKTKFTSITMFVLLILGMAANAEQKKSEFHKLYFRNAKKALQSNPKNTGQFKHLSFTENQLSVPGYSEDYTWDNDLNDWQHVSNTSYTYDNAGRLTDELLKEPETEMNISRISYAYDLSGNNIVTEEFVYNMEINQWFPVSGEQWVNTLTPESQINGVIQQTIENGEWVFKTWIKYILNDYGIPTILEENHWERNNWIPYSRMGLLTWADWLKRELAAYTKQYMQENNWVNAERVSKQFDGDNYTTTTEIWDSAQWVNSTRETYSLNSNEEELILENWTEQGWKNTEKYSGTFDDYGNPTGMKYSSWYDTGWEVELVLFLDLTYTGTNDVTELVIRSWNPSLTSPENLSKYIYSSFLHFTTDVPEISVLNNVKVFPNPVSNTFTIQIDENKIANYQVNIINLAGQTVFSNNFSHPFISVNTEKFTTGMYLLHIKTDDGRIYNTKLLKQ